MSCSNSAAKFCKRCQEKTERMANGRCKTCQKTYYAKWAVSNSERKKNMDAAYRAANKDSIYARAAICAAARDAIQPGRAKANRSEWVASNLEYQRYQKAYGSVWRAANPESVRIIHQNRRARKISNGGVLSRDLAKRLFKLQKGKCPCCSQPLGENYNLDHIVPLALGGSNTDDNIQLLRQRCNNQKHAKHPIKFMQQRGFLL